MITAPRLMVSAIAVAAALAAGVATSHLLRSGRGTIPARKDQGGTTPDHRGLSPGGTVAPAAPTRELTAPEIERLKETLGGSFASESPFVAQADAILELLRWARTSEDFATVVDALNGLPGHHEAADHFLLPLVEIVYRRWTAVDPRAAALGVTRLANRMQQHNALRHVVAAWVARDGAARVLEQVRDLPEGLARLQGPAMAFDHLAQGDPRVALEMARQEGGDPHTAGKWQNIFRNWIEQDPEAVEKWIAEAASEDGQERGAELEAALRALSWKDPKRAWEILQSLPKSAIPQRSTREELLSRLLSDHPAGAVAAVAAIADEGERSRMWRQLGTNTTMRHPSPGAEVAAHLPDDAARREFTAGVATGIIRSGADADFPTAAQLIRELPDGTPRNELLRELGRSWGRNDPPGASRWLAGQPAGAERDTLIGEFVRGVFTQDPEAALTWSGAIGDPGKRERRLGELLPRWLQQDPSTATEWIRTTDRLEPAERDAWLQRAQNPPAR